MSWRRNLAGRSEARDGGARTGPEYENGHVHAEFRTEHKRVEVVVGRLQGNLGNANGTSYCVKGMVVTRAVLGAECRGRSTAGISPFPQLLLQLRLLLAYVDCILGQSLGEEPGFAGDEDERSEGNESAHFNGVMHDSNRGMLREGLR